MGEAGLFRVHPTVAVEPGACIGEGTEISGLSHILAGAVIGSGCNICDHTLIEDGVVIGDRVIIKCGVSVCDGVTIENDVSIGPGVIFTNWKSPSPDRHPDAFRGTIIRRGASIGANATFLPGIEVGREAMVRAGALVTSNVPPRAIVGGNPATITGYVDTPLRAPVSKPAASERFTSSVAGVSLRKLKHVNDLRGDLCAAEWNKEIPFSPKRVFFVYNVPSVRVRGEHAHWECHQFLVCVCGSISVVADDGKNREEFVLDQPWIGLHLPPRVWGIQYKCSSDAVLMVLASHQYNPDDYIRDYDEFLDATARHGECRSMASWSEPERANG
jgi:acetyltransferase-like isoleucine patch superfamily enzyme/dTDP-4-dehydrorhamnose 3,5-epimerase-like enzyme